MCTSREDRLPHGVMGRSIDLSADDDVNVICFLCTFFLQKFLLGRWSNEMQNSKSRLPPRETPDGWTDDTLSHVSVSTFFVAGTTRFLGDFEIRETMQRIYFLNLKWQNKHQKQNPMLSLTLMTHSFMCSTHGTTQYPKLLTRSYLRFSEVFPVTPSSSSHLPFFKQ
jgi:hypothetical protein